MDTVLHIYLGEESTKEGIVKLMDRGDEEIPDNAVLSVSACGMWLFIRAVIFFLCPRPPYRCARISMSRAWSSLAY